MNHVIEIDGDCYKSKETNYDDCVGCAFEGDLTACKKVAGTISCSYPVSIIWQNVAEEKPVNDESKLTDNESRHENVLGVKHDADKPMYNLIPAHALDEVAKVLTFGAKKYSPDNWKHVDNPQERYFAAAQRHLWAVKRNEELDKESGLDHIAHAITCLMFMLEQKQK